MRFAATVVHFNKTFLFTYLVAAHDLKIENKQKVGQSV